MEITLEQIELVKDRTGVSYKEAKEALEYAGGNVVDAIIYIEDNIDAAGTANEGSKVDDFKKFVTETVKKGNVNRIKVYKDDELVVNLPLSAGIVGVILFRWWGIIAAVVATGVTKCRVELVKEDGTVIDITDKASDAFDTVKDKSGVIVDEALDKGVDVFDAAKAKGADLYEQAMEKGAGLFEQAKEKGTGLYDVVKDKAADFIAKVNEAADKADDFDDLFKDEFDDIFDDEDDDKEEKDE